MCSWVKTNAWKTTIQCGEGQISAGGCSGWGRDCPGGFVHMIKCCDVQDFSCSGSHPFTFGSGKKNNCR